mmetsp:Transcript_15456/g.46658  ORF Transcript_15456/g.46658 Transcript_15456/m.46658 type:complete len:81 (-) Transcript_15456:1889-2131(-)
MARQNLVANTTPFAASQVGSKANICVQSPLSLLYVGSNNGVSSFSQLPSLEFLQLQNQSNQSAVLFWTVWLGLNRPAAAQ